MKFLFIFKDKITKSSTLDNLARNIAKIYDFDLSKTLQTHLIILLITA